MPYFPNQLTIVSRGNITLKSEGSTDDENFYTNSITLYSFYNPAAIEFHPIKDAGFMDIIPFNVTGTYNYDSSAKKTREQFNMKILYL